MTIRTTILLPLVLLATMLACSRLTLPAPATSAPTSSLNSGLLHFEDQWIAFDYPQGLDVYEGGDPEFKWTPDISLPGEQVAGVGDPQHRANSVYLRAIRVNHRGLAAGADIQNIMSGTYQAIEAKSSTAGSLLAYPQTIFVDGVRAYQKAYRVFWGEPAYDLRDIWIPHNDALYIVSIMSRWSNPDDLTEFNALADGIVRSLKIK